ncbi:hypothetical protein COW36_16335 [bacterium (Candidatus Blackallbacteria) CG17_big_fil_post_rev_8_21_14_2_50_48_46]|uniref:Uncharacterized protein n=1 Tax=bacterium (Candidatus Blackallbacteria) CG17_big_fil_post_rev_8_21_14_2_50_48_46 TaxID=2014261 RepID=A0A2M7G218_9BACT|nr:MAG: hypothetical protein COW64_16805 [bacterium (Candidatus Blackallbacteria) CG18_big_fil_WC_8_21_14_2_50_49_26]PIW15703.1 MAG: hypothetical protein COW36_16335 [bacterium (Candidatus Blackallbacteria) CG17_big_fil_post_rev_8_21_14_2_50_48_46]PIW48709.1 MAG: hypothetical protein COW20_08515 [bacterium (Candidatus Blackallbacteria) CG13_big_fil_rev_8_21_14_2_50_49_14]
MTSTEPASFQAHQQQKWLEQFQQASPQGRYDLLKDVLQAPQIFLEEEVLAYAVASVSQILGHSNLLAEQRALAALLSEKAPAVYAEIEGIQALVELQEALFENQIERLPALLEIWLKPGREVPPPFGLILKTLAYFGLAEEAAAFAAKIATHLGKKALAEDESLDFALEQHRIHQVFETLLHALQEGIDPDWNAFESGLRDLGIRSKQEQGFFREQLESSDKVQMNRLRTALSEGDPELALFHCRQVFGRWMYKHHRLNLFTSGDMAQHALEMWLNQAPEPLPAFEKLVRVKPEQVREYFEKLEYDPEWDLLDAFALLWGLPHVYDWLHDLGIVNPAQRDEVLQIIAELKPELIQRRENALWSYGFVHRWPRPLCIEASVFAAEAESFAQTHRATTPLSTNPEDSHLFDEEFPAIPDELVDSVGAMLEEQGPEVLEGLLKEIEEQMGHEAVGALLAALEEQGYLELEYEEEALGEVAYEELSPQKE